MSFLIEHRAIITTIIAVALLLGLVLRLRMHAFPALLVVSLFAALAGGMAPETALQTVTQGMGGTLGFIATAYARANCRRRATRRGPWLGHFIWFDCRRCRHDYCRPALYPIC